MPPEKFSMLASSNRSLGDAGVAAGVVQPEPAMRRKVPEQQVFPHRKVRHDTLHAPILRHEAHAGANGLRRVFCREFFAVEPDLPAAVRA
jgi:hypothetical protein